ncbi:MAG TPA: hypothetical protein VJ867_08250 [Gemmatimonadaceae bacterium]|nr:hypothetical protein [Gemmatimonadaceae bacterium]
MTAPSRPDARIRLPAVDPAWTRLAGALLATVILGWSTVGVWRTRASRNTQVKQAQATLATFAEWRKRYQPAVAAESVSWRRTLLELQALGVVGDERLAMTRYVSRSAEEAGLRDVRVVIGASDTTGSDARLSTEGIRRKPASFGLSVECRGSLRAVVAFLGQLPPSVSPTRLTLVRQDGGGRHRIALAVYELTFTNGPPTLWSSVGSDHADRGGSGGDGG